MVFRICVTGISSTSPAPTPAGFAAARSAAAPASAATCAPAGSATRRAIAHGVRRRAATKPVALRIPRLLGLVRRRERGRRTLRFLLLLGPVRRPALLRFPRRILAHRLLLRVRLHTRQ